MWCTQCRQDVPGAAGADRGKLCCPRCGLTLGAANSPSATSECPTGEDTKLEPSAAAGASVEYDGWELDEQLRHIERILSRGKAAGRESQSAYRTEVVRLDPRHGGESAWHFPPRATPALRAGEHDKDSVRRSSALGALAWIALSLGTMTLVCGGVLLGWSVFAAREELWAVGMPIALGGQIALLLGLILQLDRLWHDSRRAAAKLEHVDQRLDDLKTTTTMLGTGQHSPGAAFYSHLADGAGPQLLLTDLKSQLDLLALKIMQNER